MYSSDDNLHDSRFCITFDKVEHLDKRNVVFGKVTQGMDVVRKMETTNTDEEDVPAEKILIYDCGQLWTIAFCN